MVSKVWSGLFSFWQSSDHLLGTHFYNALCYAFCSYIYDKNKIYQLITEKFQAEDICIGLYTHICVDILTNIMQMTPIEW